MCHCSLCALYLWVISPVSILDDISRALTVKTAYMSICRFLCQYVVFCTFYVNMSIFVLCHFLRAGLELASQCLTPLSHYTTLHYNTLYYTTLYYIILQRRADCSMILGDYSIVLGVCSLVSRDCSVIAGNCSMVYGE